MKKQPEHNRKNVPPQDTAKAPKSAVSRSMRTRAIVLAALFVLDEEQVFLQKET